MKKALTFLLILAVLICASDPALAQELPDPNRECTLTLNLFSGDTALDGGALTIYKVGDIALKDGNPIFSPVPELTQLQIQMDDLNAPSLAQELSAVLPETTLTGISAPVQAGTASFTKLETGLYLVIQQADDASNGFEPLNPFLISLPVWDNAGYCYEITAEPKVAPETLPTQVPETEPTQPTDPSLPQTGQLNWPIPFLSVCGIALFLLGWHLRFGKKDDHET